MLNTLLSLALVGFSSGNPVTPVQKVITLLTDLKTQVETEGAAEAQSYDSFACFCRDTTASKSGDITTGRDNINSASGLIEEKTATKASKVNDLNKRQKDHEAWTADLDAETLRCQKAKEEYDAEAADLSKAISGLTNAINAMESTKPVAFLAVRKTVEQSLALADALNLISEPKRKFIRSFLQNKAAVDPSDPSYKYHSQGIIDTLTRLLSEFNTRKTEVDTEWSKTDSTCTSTKSALNLKLTDNDQAMQGLQTTIQTLAGEIATARENLVTYEAILKDDQLYLKDLTERCETRAKDWDQRSQLRADELAALAGALTLLTDEVQGRDQSVNARALLLERKVKPEIKMASISSHGSSPSFLQDAISKVFLHGSRSAAYQVRQDKALALLRAEGQRLQSSVLSSIAVHIASDPFGEVKTLIQKLIERLVAESTSEATKKGFCDEELGKATKDRDYRFADSHKLELDIKALELKRDELTAEISLLTQELTTLRSTLDTATTDRATEKAANTRTVSTAKEGLDAVRQAITILKVFYKRAGKATVFLQASPVDEDTSGAGFAGAYQGQQEASKGIIGMLEVIESDFDRTVRTTETAEKVSQEEFVEFDRVSRASISGKETKKSLDEEDLTTTNNNIDLKVNDLTAAQGLLDDALRVFEALKPTCIDTAMSYQDRVAKREEEIQALTRALCILDTDQVEAQCA